MVLKFKTLLRHDSYSTITKTHLKRSGYKGTSASALGIDGLNLHVLGWEITEDLPLFPITFLFDLLSKRLTYHMYSFY